MFNPFIQVHAEGEVIPPSVVSITELDRVDPGVARFRVECSCHEVTIVHVPVAAALATGSDQGRYVCGCGAEHRFGVSIGAGQ